MSCYTASPAPAVQLSSEASQGSGSQAEYLLEFQECYDQVFEDQNYVSWVKAHWKEGKATREQLRFLHYIRLQECEAGAVVEPTPQGPVQDLAASEYEIVDQEAEAVTVEQLAERMGRVEHVLQGLQGLMEHLRI